ncbi:phage tail protein [Gilliamella sp. ESL0232]|nr:phage tail protein [Gilliamella sp. ESL0232]
MLHGWVEQITTANINDYLLPVGIPQPWPTTTPPDGWLKCNGWKFDKNKYPKLAQVYPSGYLPDLRGEFIRGWDDGKGTDPGRGILSWQGDAIRNIYGSTSTIQFYSQVLSNGAFGHDVLSSSGGHVGESWRGTNVALNFDASRIVPTSHDNHPRNLAFMYILKAE